MRRHHEGSLGFEERRAAIQFVIDRASGALILPVEPGFSRIAELLLLAPSEDAWAWQASLTPSIIARPESEECVDRWAAYHGKAPGAAVWIRATLTGLKSASSVWDPSDVTAPNALHACEARLIRGINADRGALARACKVHALIDVADPLAVGIDPHGMDVRARFGIIRLEFPENTRATTEAAAKQAVDFLLGHRAWNDPPGASNPAPPR